MGRKVRTNIVIDESLVSEVMETYGLESKRAAVDFALRTVLGRPEHVRDPGKAMLQLRGIWADMTDEEARRTYDSDVGDDPR
jgi:Arc/MetJ family transcription regulator